MIDILSLVLTAGITIISASWTVTNAINSKFSSVEQRFSELSKKVMDMDSTIKLLQASNAHDKELIELRVSASLEQVTLTFNDFQKQLSVLEQATKALHSKLDQLDVCRSYND